MEDIREELQDVLSLVSLLESEMEMRKLDDIYIRTTKVIHKMVKEVILDINTISVK